MSSIVENFMSKVIIKEWQRLNLCSCLRHNFSCSIFVAKWVPGSKSLVHLVLMVVRDEHSDKETGTSHLRWQKSIEKLGRISPIKPGSFKTGGGGGGGGADLSPSFFLFSWKPGGITCSKNWLTEFPPIDLYGYTRLRGVGADLFPLGQIGLRYCHYAEVRLSARRIFYWVQECWLEWHFSLSTFNLCLLPAWLQVWFPFKGDWKIKVLLHIVPLVYHFIILLLG